MSPQQQVKMLLLGLAEYLQVTLTPEQLLMYADEFKNPADLGEAIRFLKADPDVKPGRFPLPAQLTRYVRASADSDAKEVVALIFECIMEFGPSRQAEAKFRMGDFAWNVCKRYGGFGNLCNMETRDKPAIYAQLRDMAANMATRARLGIGTPELPHEEGKDLPRTARRLAEASSKGTQSIGELLSKIQPQQDSEPGAR